MWCTGPHGCTEKSVHHAKNLQVLALSGFKLASCWVVTWEIVSISFVSACGWPLKLWSQ